MLNEKELDEFYQIEPEEINSTKYFKDKLETDRAFFRSWESISETQMETLKEIFGTEFEHIHNHFNKIKDA